MKLHPVTARVERPILNRIEEHRAEMQRDFGRLVTRSEAVRELLEEGLLALDRRRQAVNRPMAR